jgi:phage-related protein
MGFTDLIKDGLKRTAKNIADTDEDGPGPISGVKKVVNTVGRGIKAADKSITDTVQDIAEPIGQAGLKAAKATGDAVKTAYNKMGATATAYANKAKNK